MNDCYLRDDDKACQLIERDPNSHDISLIHDETNNIGSTTTRGIDFALAYDLKASWGRLRNQLEGIYLTKYETDDTLTKLEGVGYYDLGAFPKLRANLTTYFESGGSSAGVNVRYIGGFKECLNDNCNDPMNREMYSRNVSSNITADLFAGYSVKTVGGTTTLTVGVNNLTDQKPAMIYQGFQGNSDAATYDYMGRFVYTRLSHLF
jgi:iron complex outermembrane recepter protein